MNPEVVVCSDLDRAVAERTAGGFRLDATGPADEPNWAQMSDGEKTLYLDAKPEAGSERFLPGDLALPSAQQSLTIGHETASGWTVGRAEMAYRDLIPDRFGGAYIASHINVKHGGPVPDYVHHHDVALQLIYCHRGWVRVVYQGQGSPFVLEPGDCILQPPGIRHQVLESSDELFVTEVSCPADHRTSIDHDLTLPTDWVEPNKMFGRGQRFMLHDSSEMPWQPLPGTPFDEQRTEMSAASAGVGELRFLRATEESLARPEEPSIGHEHDLGHDRDSDLRLDHGQNSDRGLENDSDRGLDLLFLFITAGSVDLAESGRSGGTGGTVIHRLTEGSSVAVPPGTGHRLRNPAVGTSLLELKCRRT